MAAPDFNQIGEALKILGDQISRFSEIPALRSSHRNALVQNELVQNELEQNELVQDELEQNKLVQDELEQNELVQDELVQNEDVGIGSNSWAEQARDEWDDDVPLKDLPTRHAAERRAR